MNKIFNETTLNNKIFLSIILFLAILFSFNFKSYIFWDKMNNITNNNISMLQDYKGSNILSNGDGYYFLVKAKEILEDKTIQDRGGVVNSGVSYIVAFLARYFDIDEIAFQIPSILGSLIIIPLFLIGKELKSPYIGIITGIIVSFTHSFYNRTILGYYDNDGLVLFSIMFLFYILLKYYNSLKLNNTLFIIAMFIIASGEFIHYRFFYFTTTLLLFSLIINIINEYNKTKLLKNNITINNIIFLHLILFVSILDYGFFISLFLLILQNTKYSEKITNNLNLLYFALFLTLSILLYQNNFSYINYILTRTFNSTIEENSYHFYNVGQTINEIKGISFQVLTERIANNLFFLIIGTLGYLLLIMKNKFFLIGIPFILFGFLSMKIGLRYTIYAVPFIILGSFYLTKIIEEKINFKYFTLIVNTILILFVLNPIIKHMENYTPLPSFFNEEIMQLKELEKEEKGYILAWWDYGYPLNYYTLKKSIIDGGYHSKDNFIISYLFFSDSQKLLSNLGKEILQDKYEPIIDKTLTKERIELFLNNTNKPYEYLKSFENIEKKGNNFYLYFPFKMIDILPTIKLFSNNDLISNDIINQKSEISKFNIIKMDDQYIYLTNGFIFDKKTSNIFHTNSKNNIVKFKNIDIISNKQNTITRESIPSYNYSSDYNLIINLNTKTFVVLTNDVYQSNYIQMGWLGNYNKELFEKVSETIHAVIYKTK